jgi:ribosomal protein S27E
MSPNQHLTDKQVKLANEKGECPVCNKLDALEEGPYTNIICIKCGAVFVNNPQLGHYYVGNKLLLRIK